MSNSDKLKVAELDFDQIKTNLRTFLKSQSEFSDYNFEGSGLSILLDLLAYNTHYMGYYMNMVANEMFIDTAVKRASVVSHAKLLGYTPSSRIASQATINLSFQEMVGGSNSVMSLPKFTKFSSASKDGNNYIFVTTEQFIVNKNNDDEFVFDNLRIKEGQPNSFVYTYDASTNPKQTFVLNNSGIDVSTLSVQVQKSGQLVELETFTLAEDSTEVTSDSPVYFLEENRDGLYQIYFGDGVIGKSLSDGNLVIVSYIVTSGYPANGIREFKLIDSPKPGSTVTIELVTESSSGKLEEPIDAIRFTAPKAFIAQNRAVTKNDFIALINKKYPYFDSVTVWGGEENYPPIYGKVFFSAKPRGNYEVTQTEIEYIKNYVIKPVSILTVTPEYVEPDYNYLNLVVDILFDQRKTVRTPGEVKTRVYNAIVNFASDNLNTFNGTFKMSKLARAIDNAEPSIENNSIKLYLEKRFRPALNTSTNYRLDFYAPIKRGTATDRVYSEPAFEYYDELNNVRTCFIEETPEDFSGIDEIEIVSGGSGYTQQPEVVIEGDGKGAVAEAVIVNGKIKNINIIKRGSNYSSAIAKIVGGNGSGAVLKPLLEGKKGTLRLFYYDTNNLKKIINPNIGSVYYQEGYIELYNFAPITVSDPFGTLVFKAIPNTSVFTSKRNAILTLDITDPASTQINIQQISQ